jgi:hypothetical protein
MCLFQKQAPSNMYTMTVIFYSVNNQDIDGKRDNSETFTNFFKYLKIHDIYGKV